jgi:hypothetical protein
MKKYLFIFLASYFSYLNSAETEMTLDGLQEPVTAEKTLSLPASNGIYIFPSLDRILPEGAAYRHHLNDSRFCEISFSNKKLAIIQAYQIVYDGHSFKAEKIGEEEFIYNNMLVVSYGFIYNTKYIHPYFSIGAGAFVPSFSRESDYLFEALPAISSSVGFEFGFGFIDFTMNYLPQKWTYKQNNNDGVLEELGIKSEPISLDFANDLRLGIGFRF